MLKQHAQNCLPNIHKFFTALAIIVCKTNICMVFWLVSGFRIEQHLAKTLILSKAEPLQATK